MNPLARTMVSRLLLGILTVLALAGCGSSESGSDAGPGGSQSTESEAVSQPPSTSTNSVTEPHPTERVLTADPLGGLQYRPTSIQLGEGGGGLIDSIRWRRYGGRTAVGVGIRVGVTRGSDRVVIRLRGKSECAGSPAYLQWSIEPERGGKPSFHDIMSPTFG
jgi:hypothetical protein